MKRREMLLKSLQAGALISLAKPFQIFANEKKNAILTELTGNPLRFPPVFTNGGTMTLATSKVNVWPGQNTQVLAINGSYPGPSVVMQKGSTFSANFINNYSEPATIHWHGVNVPEIMDGHPKDSIAPGGSYTYTFPVINRGGTYFYHSHADMLTAEHVFKGFAGFFIVVDPAELSLGLPGGSFDVPLCIQDRRQADIPQFNYNPSMNDVMNGFLGDVPLINGTPEAYFEVSKTLYRFRLLNGSNARIYKIAFSDNRPFNIIATDGGLKDEAVQVTSFFLSPGERTEILVDFSPYTIGQNVILKSLPFTAPGTGTYRQGTEMNLMRFDITGNTSSGGVIPSAMPPINYYNIADVKTTRNFVLTMTSGMPMHLINGLTFEMDRIDWQTPQNSLEEWKIVNASNMLHPMHSHSVQYQVYSRNGSTNLAPEDKGWKDTVLIYPLETVRLLIRFTDYKGIFLFHCHNLEHEDDGMMLNFKVVDPIGINENNGNIPAEYKLHQNYPNPFNPETKILFDLPESGNVTLKVYNQLGKEITTLYNGFKNAGSYEVIFNTAKFGLASGVYFYKLKTDKKTFTKRMILAK
ncbi:MAG TPA: multicopper oxidase domain-containing protein [Ignavibacteria bacterium]|nr:multicopper oxidase domain-containing protein [Ignavibacteria bacterium]